MLYKYTPGYPGKPGSGWGGMDNELLPAGAAEPHRDSCRCRMLNESQDSNTVITDNLVKVTLREVLRKQI